jgi:hypothetical protein
MTATNTIKAGVPTPAAASSKPRAISKEPEYTVWKSMIGRCRYPSSTGWRNYGGRGIRVCDRWASSYQAFLEDMGRRPSPRHTIGRIDSNGNYEPGNVRWETWAEQTRNRRNSRLITVDGVTRNLIDWAHLAGLSTTAISLRIKNGWDLHDAISVPSGQPNPKPVHRGPGRRRVMWLTIDGETKIVSEWAALSGTHAGTISTRIRNGWDAKRAVFEPLVDRREIANKRRSNRIVTISGEGRSVADWARHTGVPASTIYARLHAGWAPERAVFAPVTDPQETCRRARAARYGHPARECSLEEVVGEGVLSDLRASDAIEGERRLALVREEGA